MITRKTFEGKSYIACNPTFYSVFKLYILFLKFSLGLSKTQSCKKVQKE